MNGKNGAFVADKFSFAAAAHTHTHTHTHTHKGGVSISHNDTCAGATEITVTRQRLPRPFTLSLVAGHGVFSPRVNDSLMAGLVKQGMIREELRSRADDEAN